MVGDLDESAHVAEQVGFVVGMMTFGPPTPMVFVCIPFAKVGRTRHVLKDKRQEGMSSLVVNVDLLRMTPAVAQFVLSYEILDWFRANDSFVRFQLLRLEWTEYHFIRLPRQLYAIRWSRSHTDTKGAGRLPAP